MEKFICYLLTFSFIFSNLPTGYANNIDKNKCVKFTQENVEKYEKKENIDLKKSKKFQDNYIVIPNIADPGEQSTRVITTNRWTTGYTYEDDEKTGNLGTIKDIGLIIVNKFSSENHIVKVITAVNDVATICFGLSSLFIDQSKGATARLYHSFSYYDHFGQIWNGSRWITKVEIETREWYKHEFASFAGKDGKTYTSTCDRGLIMTDKKAHFDDYEWIKNKTLEAWIAGKPNYVDSFTRGVFKY